MLTACTIIARNYLPYARVLADSFAAHHPGSTFIVLIIDDERRELETDGEPFRCMRLSDIGFSADETGRLAGIYDVTELATAVKPQLLAHLLTDSEHVVYLDPDIKIFDSLDEVGDLARNHDIVLTPHTTVPLPRDGRRVDSRHVLGSGVYNLGFIGVGSGARPFLEWWGENTKREALVSHEQMMFTDQRWIDFAPAFFRHYLLKDPGYNVAYWNLHGRDLVWKDGRYLVNDYPLRFFHFSGFNYRQPHLLSKHQDDSPRVLLSERPALARICAEYVQDLHRAGIDKLRDLPYGWERLENGFRLDSRSRRVYWNALVAHERDGGPEPPNPFAANNAEAFIAWLNEPHPEGPRGFSRYLFSIYQNRVDLQIAFRDIGGADDVAFKAWLQSNGVGEEAIPVELLPSVTPPATQRVFTTPAALQPGINVAGYLSAELGIGEAARLMIQTIEHARIPHSTSTFTRTNSRQQQAFVPRGAGRGEYDLNLVCVNADQMPHFAWKVGRDFFEGRHTVGYWFWELERLPESMFPGFKYVDEVWAATRFVTDAIASANQRPVYTVPIPVPVPTIDPSITREQLNLPDAFVFLFVFDFFSVIERKNPIGLVRAFKRAFRPNEGPVLIVKTINGHKCLNDLEQLRFEVGSRDDIRVLDEYYTAAQKNALIGLADCYVSLHRSEGFGLTMAEAMALGKPVIATGYSGNLDFMTPNNSFLLDYALGTVPAGCAVYTPGVPWAEPSVESAAEAMRRVVENPNEATKRAQQGQRDIFEKHGVASCVKVLNRRLEGIRQSRQTTRPVAASTAGRIEPSPAAGAARHSSVAAAMAAATALLTPVEGLPPTARFRGVRLRLQQLLLRGMRAYWWQQRSLQSALIDGVKAVDLESKRRYEELLQRTVELEAVVSTEHDVQDGAAAQLKVLTTHLGEAARELNALTTHLNAVAAESRTLRHRLYAQPYMADPKQFLVADERGRPQLGFDDGSGGETDVYDGFEDIFRGTETLIRDRARVYVPLLKDHQPILDIGCGRGELLEALRDAGLTARGVDLDAGMVARSRAKQLDVAHADAIEYLRKAADDTFGAITAIQFIEHLPYDALLEFFRLSRSRLVPGGVLIAETVNPHSLEAFKTFWTDLTHRAPIFPEVALALVRLHGFARARAIFPHGTGDLDRDRQTTGEYAIVATK